MNPALALLIAAHRGLLLTSSDGAATTLTGGVDMDLFAAAHQFGLIERGDTYHCPPERVTCWVLTDIGYDLLRSHRLEDAELPETVEVSA